MNEIKKLNIGSGRDRKEGYVNLDIIKLKEVDVVWDLDRYPYPYKDNTFEEVYADNIMEHLSSIIKPMEEIYRICKNGAIVNIIVPYTPSVWAFVDPTHKQFYTYFTMNYFMEKDMLNYYSKARFQILKRNIVFNKFIKPIEWLVNANSLFKKIYATFFYFLIPANFLIFKLKVKKD